MAWQRNASGVITVTNVSGRVLLDTLAIGAIPFGVWIVICDSIVNPNNRELSIINATLNSVGDVSFNRFAHLIVGEHIGLSFDVVKLSTNIQLYSVTSTNVTYSIFRFWSNESYSELSLLGIDSNHILTNSILGLNPQPTLNALNLTSNTSIIIPPYGVLALYSQSFSNKVQAATFDSGGRQDALQRSLYSNNIVLWTPNSGATISPAYGTTWIIRNNGGGSGQTKPALSSTNSVTQMNRNLFSTGTSASGSAGVQSTDAIAWMGNAANYGGFFFHARFALETYLASERFFIGVSVNNAAMATNPSTWANSIGVCKDSTDTTIQFLTSNTAGTFTKNNTALVPSTSQVYDLYIYVAPNSGQVIFTLMNPINISTPLAYYATTSTVPANNVFMYIQAHIQSTVGTTSKQLALSKMYLETDL